MQQLYSAIGREAGNSGQRLNIWVHITAALIPLSMAGAQVSFGSLVQVVFVLLATLL